MAAQAIALRDDALAATAILEDIDWVDTEKRMAGPEIFISYRRGSDNPSARLLWDKLNSTFQGNVFLDVENTEGGGKRFPDEIRNKIASCSAFVAVIGEGWLNHMQRLEEEEDWVRKEISQALKRKDLHIITVLIEEANLPGKKFLPVELHTFPEYEQFKLQHWNYDETVRAKIVPALRSALEPPSGHFDAVSGIEIESTSTQLVEHMAISFDGRLVAAIKPNGYSVFIWSADTGALIRKLDAIVNGSELLSELTGDIYGTGSVDTSAIFFDDAAQNLIVIKQSGHILRWRTDTWKEQRRSRKRKLATYFDYGVSVSPDNRFVIRFDRSLRYRNWFDVREFPSSKRLAYIEADTGIRFRDALPASGGRYLLTLSSAESELASDLMLFHLQNGRDVKKAPWILDALGSEKVICAAFSSTGKKIAVGCESGAVLVLSIYRRKVVARYPSDGAPVIAVAIVPESDVVFKLTARMMETDGSETNSRPEWRWSLQVRGASFKATVDQWTYYREPDPEGEKYMVLSEDGRRLCYCWKGRELRVIELQDPDAAEANRQKRSN